ncbi:MAG: SAM-dependent chlorinase/fluorinase [Chloroflexota bacterium]|nr:SAM-dependent chlorinase/fluorinase [Chloroflexota bacterium]
MKLTILADIHGNLPALKAVLRHAQGRGATERILNLGDATGYGPFPNKIVNGMHDVRWVNILGNYDKKAVSKANKEDGWKKVNTPDKRAMFDWTYHALSKRARKFLRALPESRQVTLGGKTILMTHGSPASHTEHLLPETPQSRFEALAELAGVDIVLCGHSHQAFTRQVGETLFINPGSLGRPDDGDPRASYAILTMDGDDLRVEHFRVPYDLMPSVRKLRRSGLPLVFTQVVRQGLNYDDVVDQFGADSDPTMLDPCGTVTLMTDFGLQDHFIGVMKGVIARIAPQAKVIDISHQVQPQNIQDGARMLAEAAPYFPAGAVHVAVVDPGVGTSRRAIAARIGDQFFVAPDNGLLTPVLEAAEAAGEPIAAVELDRPAYWLPDPSSSFHGRDIFSPAGAHLVNGVPLNVLGTPLADPVRIEKTAPVRTENGWEAEVVWVDVFGNLSTNLTEDQLPADKDTITLQIGDETLNGVAHTFANAKPGSLTAIIDSSGHLAIAVVNGSAAERLGVGLGGKVTVTH